MTKIPSPRSHKRARIEIIPLIDIMFFLLATFVMVSLSMVKNQGISVHLPAAKSSAPQSRESSVVISVTAAGEIFLDKEAVTIEKLIASLKDTLSANPDPKVFINGDKEAKFGKAIEVLDEVRKLGITHIAIETEPGESRNAMNARMFGCAAAALAVHIALLFGLRLDSSAVALAMSDAQNTVEVALVEEAPQEDTAPPPDTPPPPEPPQPPPPAPTPPQDQPPPPPDEPMTEPSPAPVENRPPAPAAPARPSVRTERPAHPGPKVAAPRSSGAPGQSAVAGPTTLAHYRSNPKPEYPEEARQKHQSGVVMLSVEVSAEGRVTEVSISRSSGVPSLDRAASEVLHRWIFEPARTLGLPMASRVEVPIRFTLPAQ